MVLVVICLCVYSLHRVPDLRSTPLFSIVRVLMLLDISYIIIGKAHNIPCEIAGQALYGQIMMTAVLLAQCIRWFSQLLALPILSSLHFLCVYRPLLFRKLRPVHGYPIVGLFFSLSVLLTVPLFTECCGYKYYVKGFYWAYDFEKPGTELYNQLNVVLQSICVIVMLICDAFILYKVYAMKARNVNIVVTSTQNTAQLASEPSGHTSTNFGGQRAPARLHRQLSIEKKLTRSFLFLSLSFIIPTILFNLRPSFERWQFASLLNAICSVVDYSKWFLYALATTLIRKELVRVLNCQR